MAWTALTQGEPTVIPVDILSGTAWPYQMVLEDEDGMPPDVDTLTLTLYSEQAPSTFINGRDEQSVLGANGGTYNSGVFTMGFASEDMPFVGSGTFGDVEKHIALFEWTWDDPAKKGAHELHFYVRKTRHI